MRTQTLNTYVNSKFKEYYKKPLRFKTLLAESENDQRLAELAQVHFLLLGDQDKADAFVKWTYERYLLETFKLSDQKYVYQFKKQLAARRKLNRYARETLRREFEVNNKTPYRVAKELNVHQSNLSEFYFKCNNNKLDAKKVLNKYGW